MINTIGNLVGGLGLLLIGMSLMTDGLKLAAGNTLRNILALWTNTPKRGLVSGFLITGIVQSSSAVTVATIGFANAGMLSLEQAIWVIFGSNVGTTMTAWIVALVGFKLNIEALALPLIGLGTLLKLTGKESRRGPLGLAMVGFGLLFLGIGVLKGAFDMLGPDVSLPQTVDMTLASLMAFILVGFILTTLMQSSSAAMVIALSAAESGLMPFTAAAAVVIGANLGTTTTAIISVFGATATAKRVALAHVSFNVITAIVAVLLLVPMIWLLQLIQGLLNLDSSPAVSLALFHTIFNVMGVLLMWPLSGWMVAKLATCFRTGEEEESRPKYLDKNVLALPYIAIDALSLELSRIANKSISLLKSSLRHTGINNHHDKQDQIIRNLTGEVGSFTTQLSKTELTPFLSEALLNLMHATQEYLLILDISEDVASLNHQVGKYRDSEFQKHLDAFILAVDRHLDSMTPDNVAESLASSITYQDVEDTYSTLKDAILRHTAVGKLAISDMDQLLQYANQVKRASRHSWKAARRLNAVRQSLQRNPEGKVVQSDFSDETNIELLQDTARSLNEEQQQEKAAT